MKGAPVLLTFQRVANHEPPTWPEGSTPKQLHVELSVDDLEAAELQAMALGATRADTQPTEDAWRVLFDPAGHPFGITHRHPDALTEGP